MKKVIGYVIALVGVALLIITLGVIKIDIGFLKGIDNLYILIGSVIFILFGIAFVLGNNKKKKLKIHEEVPIYQGPDIVGYRRN